MFSSSTPLLVLCSFPDEAVARQIGTLLIEKQLAACVSFSASQSIYRWKGEVESAVEVMAQIKTRTAHFDALRKTIQENHPYEVPEIIGVPITEISLSYRNWLLSALREDI